MTDILFPFIVFLSGLTAGFINIASGGGSFITVPILIILGLDPAVANATNRISLATQNISAIIRFQSSGLSHYKTSFLLGSFCFLGSFIGAEAVLRIDAETFKRVYSITIFIALALMLLDPVERFGLDVEKPSKYRYGISVVLFFFLGIYAGMFQAGTGLLIMVMLRLVMGFDLLKVSIIKVVVILCTTLISSLIFILEGQVNWFYMVFLSMGFIVGGWISAHLAIKKGDPWIRRLLFVTMILLATKLILF